MAPTQDLINLLTQQAAIQQPLAATQSMGPMMPPAGYPQFPSTSPMTKALSMLPPEVMQTLMRVVAPDNRQNAQNPHVAGGVTSAYTLPKDQSINVTDWSPTYENALKGNPDAIKALAAIIGHEQFHVKNGAPEGPAYDAQLEILKRLGAPQSKIDEIQRSKDYVTSNPRR